MLNVPENVIPTPVKIAAVSMPVTIFAEVYPGGSASVTLVPVTVAIVVPGGTLTLSTAAPATVIPVPLPSVAESEPFVVASDVLIDPHTATLSGPRKACAYPGPTAEKVPVTTSLAKSPAGGVPIANAPDGAGIPKAYSLNGLPRRSSHGPQDIHFAVRPGATAMPDIQPFANRASIAVLTCTGFAPQRCAAMHDKPA